MLKKVNIKIVKIAPDKKVIIKEQLDHYPTLNDHLT